jgi:hypothetical protein
MESHPEDCGLRFHPGQNVGVDLGGLDVSMTQQLLDRADVVPGLQQVSGKAVAESMATRRLHNARAFQCQLHRSLQGLGMSGSSGVTRSNTLRVLSASPLIRLLRLLHLAKEYSLFDIANQNARYSAAALHKA